MSLASTNTQTHLRVRDIVRHSERRYSFTLGLSLAHEGELVLYGCDLIRFRDGSSRVVSPSKPRRVAEMPRWVRASAAELVSREIEAGRWVQAGWAVVR